MCSQAHFSRQLPSFKCSHFKKEKLIQKGMNTVSINTFCLLKTNSGTSYHLCDFFFNNRLKKPQSFYLLITCSHSGNLTVLMMYQFHNFIHNEHTSSKKSSLFHHNYIPFRKCPVKKICTSLWVLSTSVYTVGCTAGSRWCR